MCAFNQQNSLFGFFKYEVNGRTFTQRVSNPSEEEREVIRIADKALEITAHRNEPIQFMFAFGNNDLWHWSGLVIQVEKNKADFLFYDTINQDPGVFARRLQAEFLYRYKQRELSKFYVLRTNAQRDHSSCSWMTLDALFHLSKLNVFQLLNERPESLSAKDIVKTSGIELCPKSVPPEFAVLFRDTQSFEAINNLPETLKSHVINKKNETLDDNVKANSQLDKAGHLQNASAAKKNHDWVNHIQEEFDKDPQTFVNNVKRCGIGPAIDEEIFLRKPQRAPSPSIFQPVLAQQNKNLDASESSVTSLTLDR